MRFRVPIFFFYRSVTHWKVPCTSHRNWRTFENLWSSVRPNHGVPTRFTAYFLNYYTYCAGTNVQRVNPTCVLWRIKYCCCDVLRDERPINNVIHVCAHIVCTIACGRRTTMISAFGPSRARCVFAESKKKKNKRYCFYFFRRVFHRCEIHIFFFFAPRTKVRVIVVPTRYSALVQQSALNAVSLNVYQRFFDIIVITRLRLHTNVMISYVPQIRIRNGRYVIAIILLLYNDKSYCYLIIFFFYFVIIKTNRAMIVDSLRP